MHFWRYDLEDALHWMISVWWRPTSRPALMVVAGVAAAVLAVRAIAAVV
jgi:hypothetical protein